ncbi:MAG: lipid IV(A) 3-deoxy-D-manno-octulosonic acid transferase [Proteobacteria bacterium]|nr:lipid IV(A) 3-deoxy-D-manno-octulosonic acid transferase [Pseudomonadota bacterium]
MRFAYALVTYLLMPVYAVYWIVRGFGNPSYRDRFGQRFGFGYPLLPGGSTWIHAVSVGEVQAAVPLINSLASRFPDRQLLVTTVTPTGAARVEALFGDSVQHCYIPFETPFAVTRFFNSVRPDIALILETEIWPNLYHECGRREIPLVLVSARISPDSVDTYRRFLPLFRETLSYGIVIAAQSETDAERFRSLGAAPERTKVTGNIKFDFELPKDLLERGEAFRHDNFEDRPVWVAASTHDREEEQVLLAHEQVCKRFPDALLILVPRHPERFAAVRSLLHKQGFNFVARTDGVPCTSATEVYLGDTMGDVPLFYAAANVAFVGGSLVPIGGHNLLEPAALGRPVVTGPHLFHTQDIADKFEKVGASIAVNNADQLGAAVAGLFADKARATDIGNRGREIVQQNKGALDRLLKLLEPLLGNVA